jgi:hypothetical protein
VKGKREKARLKSSMSYSCLLPFLLCLLTFLSTGCGRKGLPRAPEDVRPQPLADLAATNVAGGVQLSWSRPQFYVDGTRMPDLGGFFVDRATGDALTYQRIAELTVTDRDRFRQVKRFTHVDPDVTPGVAYRYRVVSFTVDRYFGAPSNTVTIERTLPNEGRNAPLPTPQR